MVSVTALGLSVGIIEQKHLCFGEFVPPFVSMFSRTDFNKDIYALLKHPLYILFPFHGICNLITEERLWKESLHGCAKRIA